MASVFTARELETAHLQGWRTFRVLAPDAPRTRLEIVCPGSAEAGYVTTCDHCTLCNGARSGVAADSRASIAILPHGARKTTTERTLLRVIREESSCPSP